MGGGLIMIFASRHDAGRRLGKYLREHGMSANLVLGLPRGGVVVAAEVARELNLPLDVLVVCKIGYPFQPEFAVGALAEPDSVFFTEETLREFPVPQAKLDKVIAAEKARLQDYRRRFHLSAMPALEGKIVLLVDDGLATGATAEAAIISVRQQNPRRVILAVPVASPEAANRLRHAADNVIVLSEEPSFHAVGQFYDEFAPTEDEEVIALLKEAAGVKV
jgi:putative phosphoribosyl transferase